jgi:hypothetical protein
MAIGVVGKAPVASDSWAVKTLPAANVPVDVNVTTMLVLGHILVGEKLVVRMFWARLGAIEPATHNPIHNSW